MRRNKSSVLFLTLYPIVALLILACIIVTYFHKNQRKATNDEDHHEQGTLSNEERKSNNGEQTEDVGPTDILLLNSTNFGHKVSREVEIKDKQLFKAKADTIMADFEAQMEEVIAKSPCYQRAGWHCQTDEKRPRENTHQEQFTTLSVRKPKFHPIPLPDESIHNIL